MVIFPYIFEHATVQNIRVIKNKNSGGSHRPVKAGSPRLGHGEEVEKLIDAVKAKIFNIPN
jgi:hypothetical protein